MPETVAVAVLCIAGGGVLAQWVAWRVRLPAIVLLFVTGLLMGPGFGVLHPSQAFGPALHPVIGLAVAIIVFEGGLGLEIRELRLAGEGVLRLTCVALPLNFVLAFLAAHLVGAMGWAAAALFAAITVVTGPTVVLPLLRHTRLQQRAAAFLKWEAIVNDPVGAILASIVLDLDAMTVHAGGSPGLLLLHLAIGVAVAAGLGVGAGAATAWAFRRDQVPELLKTPMLLALALCVFAVANTVMDESGLLAATVLGMTLANTTFAGAGELKRFKEALVVLVVSALFVVLTADLSRGLILGLSWPVLALTLAMLFVVRPAAILLATIRSKLTWPERLLAAWIAPRGIVAAAVAGIAGLQLTREGLDGAALVMPSVFALIAATMVLHGFTLRPLARRLGLTLGNAPGLAIVGARAWSTDLAHALQEAEVPVLLVDTFPGALDEARRRGIPVLQAELLSEHGDEQLSGRPVDYLVAATRNDIYNAAICTRLAPEYGWERVLQVPPADWERQTRGAIARENRGRLFAGAARTIERQHAAGWRFECRPGGGEDTAASPDPLLVVRRGGMLVFPSLEDEERLTAGPGDTAIVFCAPSTEDQELGGGTGSPEASATLSAASVWRMEP